MPNSRRFCSLHLLLPALLLRIDHLLASSLALRLLLLHFLAHAFGLRLASDARACNCLRGHWLLPQLLQLLSCVSIATRGLSREIGHLALARLLSGESWLLRRLLRGRSLI